ncbi:MAG: hypothetical protein ACRDFS_06750 [Chloroflexota bacterium]
MLDKHYVAAKPVEAASRPKRKTDQGGFHPIRALSDSIPVQLMLAMSLVAMATLFLFIQSSQASVIELNLQSLQNQQTQLNATAAGLQAATTRLQTPQHIQSIAINQLHMSKPNPSSMVWVAPTVVLPRTKPVSATDAKAQSQPLAWMERFIRLVRSSL